MPLVGDGIAPRAFGRGRARWQCRSSACLRIIDVTVSPPAGLYGVGAGFSARPACPPASWRPEMNRSTSNDTSSEGYEYLALPFDPWPSGPTRDIIYRLGPFKGCVSVDAEADAQEILSVLHRALRDDVCSL